MDNGMTLEKAVNRPNSNLAKVVRYLVIAGPSSKADICINALGFKVSSGRVLRGWHSYLFRAMRIGQFIEGNRAGRGYLYSLGTNAPLVKIK
jgi:hypothetical protein